MRPEYLALLNFNWDDEKFIARMCRHLKAAKLEQVSLPPVPVYRADALPAQWRSNPYAISGVHRILLNEYVEAVRQWHENALHEACPKLDVHRQVDEFGGFAAGEARIYWERVNPYPDWARTDEAYVSRTLPDDDESARLAGLLRRDWCE